MLPSASRNGVAPSGLPTKESAHSARRNDWWLTAAEVAELLDCSERSVWKWEAEGVIPPAVRRGKKFTRWKRAEIEAYRDGMWKPN